jgi:hypothetical protein
VSNLSTSFDLKNIEEIVERVLRKVRSEELKLIAEAVKTLADYMKTGFKEALERIVSIEERIEKIGERLEEHSKILQEHSKRLEELMLIIQEHSKILREHSKRLEELTAIISDQNRRIGEYLMVLLAHSKKIEELTRAISEFKITLGSIGRRWGRDLEETVIRLYRHVLEERGVIPEKIERFVYEDKEGRYYVKGSRIEFDMYVHDDRVYLIEVKSHADRNDVEWFYKRAEIYEKITSRKPDKLILIAVNIDVGAYERARELGMDVIYGSLIP